MWDKLLALFKDTPVTDEVHQPGPTTSSPDQMDASPTLHHGKSVHLGYNYLKGMDGKYEDSSNHIRRFRSLNKLLRGKYHGKINASHETEEGDLRGEDDE